MNKIGNKNIIKKMFGNKEIIKEVFNGSVIYEKVVGGNYITFSSPQSFTVAKNGYNASNDGTVEYSTDTENWNTWDGTAITGVLNNGTYNVYLRGSNNTYYKGRYAGASYSWFTLTGSNISCSGNIENLLDYQTVANGGHPQMANATYQYLFANLKNLIEADIIIPSANTQSCCSSMFVNCSALYKGPSILPATALATYSYSHMFEYCSELLNTPALPATTLAESCYTYMFSQCTKITSTPNLQALNLPKSCYNSMFSGCVSLTHINKLSINTLNDLCCSAMFYNCTSLENIPVLSAITLAQNCYNSMFSGCTSLYVSDTQTAEAPYAWTIPSSGTFTNSYNQSSMFANCLGTRASNNMPGEAGQSYTYYTQNQPVGD